LNRHPPAAGIRRVLTSTSTVARAEGIAGFRRGLALLSDDARNLVTVENDEMSYGLDDLLPLADCVSVLHGYSQNKSTG
jgi:UV DNA damage repair endonuclease